MEMEEDRLCTFLSTVLFGSSREEDCSLTVLGHSIGRIWLEAQNRAVTKTSPILSLLNTPGQDVTDHKLETDVNI